MVIGSLKTQVEDKMKRAIITRVTDLLTEEVLSEIGVERIPNIDPDSVDAIIQKAVDEIETQVYDKILVKINEELANCSDHMDRWW